MTTLKLILKTILYKPLFNALIFLVWLIPGHNVVWAIIILTIVIRLILLPSSLKANRAQIKLRQLQPEMTKIQEKYKDDRQAQSKALMDFYKEHKVSPWGSCLPLLIQFPILIVLYYVFINGLNTARFDLLYPFTPRPEAINTVLLGINLAHPDRWVLPIITGVLQFIQGWQMQGQFKSPKPKEGEKDQSQAMQNMMGKQMLYIMPVFSIIIAMRLPAALPLYWSITTLIGIGVWYWAAKTTPKIQIASAQEENEQYKPKSLPETINKIKKGGVEITVRRKR